MAFVCRTPAKEASRPRRVRFVDGLHNSVDFRGLLVVFFRVVREVIFQLNSYSYGSFCIFNVVVSGRTRVSTRLDFFFRSCFSGFCVAKRCSVTMWMFSNHLSKVFYQKIDYWYHEEHDIQVDLPVHDPFETDASDSRTIFNAMAFTSSQRDKLETKLVLAVFLFIISTLSSLSTYSYYGISLIRVCKS